MPQEFLQILIYIILSFLIRIYEPMIITANCELATLTDRWYFYEPNKISLAIFGQLRNLLRFIEVQFITKINKHFYSSGNYENRILLLGPIRAGSTHSAFLPPRTSRPQRGPRGGAAQLANGPRRGKTCARWQIRENAPELLGIYSER